MSLTPSRLAVSLLLLAGVFAGGIVLAGTQPRASTPPPISHYWVLTQSNCLPPQADALQPGLCKPADIPVNGLIEIQLPATPATWTVQSASPNVTFTGSQTLPNPQRIEGTSELVLWDFFAARAGTGTIVLREFPPTISDTPSGIFTYTFNVK